ncbi:hypothetical protein EMEDMD4_790403 [Sinorhizobium medicae]|uniref:Uncharacterized protein n=1 Tax=Sinorhizobium medicae TaxID=110321 RepID=A0A508X6T4_9HYPH|nr:hypothetical protein EMEDMD4_790403 [Sinorhizobium medicae]
MIGRPHKEKIKSRDPAEAAAQGVPIELRDHNDFRSDRVKNIAGDFNTLERDAGGKRHIVFGIPSSFVRRGP